MSSSWRAVDPPRLFRWLAPWSALVLLAALVVGALPAALAAPGDSPSEAIVVGPQGRFSGVAAPQKSQYFRVAYKGGDAITVSVFYQPADSSRTDLVLYTGSASNPRREGTSATRSDNNLSISFSDPNAQDVFVQFVNDHPDRSVSFAGTVQPESQVSTPDPAPTAGPTADTPQSAITVGADGVFSGTIAGRRATWYRFYYANPGVDATVTASFAPDATNADLSLYTGADANSLQPQSGSPTTSGNSLSRRVNLSSAQFVYVTVVNNNDSTVLGYAGRVNPASAPPTPTPAPATATATPQPAATATPAPRATPEPAPPLARDERFFFETGYRVESDIAWDFFRSRGGIDTFGYPVSRTFTFLGCPVQIFQRLIIQLCPGQGPALINLLDPEIFPYTRVNQSVFPPPDDTLKNATPKVSDPNYGSTILDFVRANAPDTFEGEPVNFGSTFFAQGGLEIWGAPISAPARDPGNSNFIYQRFQRGIMHYIKGQGTRGILLADYLKAILQNNSNLPQDLRQQAQGSKYFNQYAPGADRWLNRPAELGGTDLRFAFEPG